MCEKKIGEFILIIYFASVVILESNGSVVWSYVCAFVPLAFKIPKFIIFHSQVQKLSNKRTIAKYHHHQAIQSAYAFGSYEVRDGDKETN